MAAIADVETRKVTKAKKIFFIMILLKGDQNKGVLVAEQFVDAHLAPRSFIDLLNNHSTIEAVTAI